MATPNFEWTEVSCPQLVSVVANHSVTTGTL